MPKIISGMISKLKAGLQNKGVRAWLGQSFPRVPFYRNAIIVLRRLRRICDKLDIDSAGETEEEQELIKMTDPHELMRDLQEKLPD